jgi:hypothetical protein
LAITFSQSFRVTASMLASVSMRPYGWSSPHTSPPITAPGDRAGARLGLQQRGLAPLLEAVEVGLAHARLSSISAIRSSAGAELRVVSARTLMPEVSPPPKTTR